MKFIHVFKPVVMAVSLGALAMSASVPALAFDTTALTAGTLPTADTKEEAEVCAAVSSFGAYALLQGDEATLSPEDKEYQELVVNVAYAWVGFAAKQNSLTDEVYMDSRLFPDMETVGALDNDTFMKHFGNCFERLVAMAEQSAASASSAAPAGTVN